MTVVVINAQTIHNVTLNTHVMVCTTNMFKILCFLPIREFGDIINSKVLSFLRLPRWILKPSRKPLIGQMINAVRTVKVNAFVYVSAKNFDKVWCRRNHFFILVRILSLSRQNSLDRFSLHYILLKIQTIMQEEISFLKTVSLWIGKQYVRLMTISLWIRKIL